MSKKYLDTFLGAFFRKFKWRHKSRIAKSTRVADSVHIVGANCVFLTEYLVEDKPQQTVSSKMVSEVLLKYVA